MTNTEQTRVAAYLRGWNDAMMKRAPKHGGDLTYMRGYLDAQA